MKWFKHMSNSADDEKLSLFVDTCGLEGYGFWWRIMEIVAIKIDENDSTGVKYSLKKWCHLIGIRPQTFRKLLGSLTENGLVKSVCEKKSSSPHDVLIFIDIPNILKYRDEYSNRKSKTSGQNPDTIGSSFKDTELKKELNTPPYSPHDFLKHKNVAEKKEERAKKGREYFLKTPPREKLAEEKLAEEKFLAEEKLAGKEFFGEEFLGEKFVGKELLGEKFLEKIQKGPCLTDNFENKNPPQKTDCPSKGHPQYRAFKSCYEVYPVKQAEEEAWREWFRLYENRTLGESYAIREKIIILATDDARWARGYAPKMTKWLNGKGWNDEPYIEPSSKEDELTEEKFNENMRKKREKTNELYNC